ncbi:hypothetical protein H072_8787 [Dactylellina haptotyla CBS 200.50]|uniref:Nitrogen regulatory protein areA GATA-like domain-containing protein n=1 Tax=Dactylellina haptotyla (strain CBS 200.50) TaxID=1284197 RepID=S8A3C2_DACHA|nr:hypothetical protein H072_8787 [Dactylellina haptotyla CBS 200.50]
MMNHGLPQIVDSRQTLTDDIRKIDKVQVEELTRLWKVYTTNKNIISTGRRLENLFWRIWGSNRIQENISGNTVARIFLMIDQGEEAIANAYKIPPMSKSIIRQVPIDISVPPTPPPSPYSRLSPSSNLIYQPSQTALSASLLQAYPNTPPSPALPPKVPPPSPAVLPEVPSRPTLARAHQSFPQSTNDSQQQIGREMVSSKATSSSGRRRKHPQGILRTSISERKNRIGPSALSRTTSNSSNATASSGISTPVTSVTEMSNLQDASQSGKETDHTNSVESEHSLSSSRKGSQAGSAKSKEDWLVEPDFRAKYLEQRKKDRLSAIAGNPIVKGPLKTSPTIATASMTAVAIPRTKRGRGRSILVVDSVAPLKSADDEDDNSGLSVPVVENPFSSIKEMLPTLVEKEPFEKPLFQRTKSQLSLMIEKAKRNADGEITEEDTPRNSAATSQGSPAPEVIPEDKVHPDDGFEDESDEPLEMRQRTNSKKSSKTRKPKLRKFINGNFLALNFDENIPSTKISAPKLRNVTGDVYFSRWVNLETMDFPVLTTINRVRLNNLPKLTSANFLSTLESIENNYEVWNTSLSEIKNDKLPYAIFVEIFDNPLLEKIELTALKNASYNIALKRNRPGLEVSLPALTEVWYLELNKISKVEIPNLESAIGHFLVNESSIETIDAPKLKTVGLWYAPEIGITDNYGLRIENSPQLTDMSFPVLEAIQLDLVIRNNSALTDVDFPVLKRVTGNIAIQGALTSIELPALKKVGDSVFLGSTTSGFSCGDLGKYKANGSIRGDFECPSLTELPKRSTSQGAAKEEIEAWIGWLDGTSTGPPPRGESGSGTNDSANLGGSRSVNLIAFVVGIVGLVLFL